MIADDVDNCPGIDNPTQGDSDADGLGDACDPTPLPPGALTARGRFVGGAGIASVDENSVGSRLGYFGTFNECSSENYIIRTIGYGERP